MFRLAFILHLFIGSTLAGSAVIAALVLGQDSLQPILFAAAVGFLTAFPVTWLVARRLYSHR
ncbi:CTP synthetase [Phycobacter azelaicus]|uniref:CTP synthetase n=1 Tax=Phycobacter azelaicus TaxID=2668075 RepID=UPI0018663EB7|nr:CTP synthetase [Phycobacter azelaicus]MBE1297112.1 CTP synthetase [Paracoccaceae bacterium]